MQVQFFVKNGFGFGQYHGIGDAAQIAAATKNIHLYTQSRECLPQFQADDALSKHRYPFGQSVPVKDIVVDNQFVAQRLPFGQDVRA